MNCRVARMKCRSRPSADELPGFPFHGHRFTNSWIAAYSFRYNFWRVIVENAIPRRPPTTASTFRRISRANISSVRHRVKIDGISTVRERSGGVAVVSGPSTRSRRIRRKLRGRFVGSSFLFSYPKELQLWAKYLVYFAVDYPYSWGCLGPREGSAARCTPWWRTSSWTWKWSRRREKVIARIVNVR